MTVYQSRYTKCEDCIFWRGLELPSELDMQIDQCECYNSDHFGHVLTFDHPACEHVEDD